MLLPGFHHSPWFQEQTREIWLVPEVHVVLNAADDFDPGKPSRLVLFTTPNGNTVEQTLGSARTEQTDWHVDIQHVAAQLRFLRARTPGENVVLACLAAKSLSWPAWRQRHPNNAARIRGIVERLRALVPGASTRVALAGHSGGGSFLFGFLNGGEQIPEFVDTIALLDANYAYSDTERHGEKLLAWLAGDRARHLTVIAYDDREITLNGKKVVGPEGGTFRATERMRTRFAREMALSQSEVGPVVSQVGRGGQVVLRVHQNPQNRILHTALVGEWNGLLSALSDQPFAEPRVYTKHIQPATGIPPRPADALAGSALFQKIKTLPVGPREELLVAELLRGNLPPFLRTPCTVTRRAGENTLLCSVWPDYLAVGSDTDFVRCPLTPRSARMLADAFGAILPTRLLVDAIYAQANLKLEPLPLTEAREAPSTFVLHQEKIEAQRQGNPTGQLIAGTKKDVVWTNRLQEKPARVAIYGWHRPDGQPIQPLTIVHHETYVDYSHGIRLIARQGLLNGKPCDLLELLQDPLYCRLLSDEGPITP